MQKSLHFQLMMTHNRVNHQILTGAAKLGLLPGQPKVLEYLSEHDGATQNELVQNCELDKSTITGIVKRMEARQLLHREKSTQDARSTRVFLTEQGKLAASQLEELFEKVDRKAWGTIPEEEQQIFLSVLKKIRHNMH